MQNSVQGEKSSDKKKIREKKWFQPVVAVLATLIISVVIIVPFVFGEIKDALDGKNDEDVEILRDMIIKYTDLLDGYRRDEIDIDSNRYTWEDGRLVGINWYGVDLSEHISFEGLDALKTIDVSGDTGNPFRD